MRSLVPALLPPLAHRCEYANARTGAPEGGLHGRLDSGRRGGGDGRLPG
jgi:hypothetical protein